MNDRRLQFAEETAHAGELPQSLSRGFAESDKANVVALDAKTKVGDLGQCDHDVPKAFRRESIDEIDDAIFQTAGVEAEQDVGDQVPAIGCHEAIQPRLRESKGPIVFTTRRGNRRQISIARRYLGFEGLFCGTLSRLNSWYS